ncbi:MAG: hypothetical protein JXB30_04670 [Anaerolineae bacterium]|nr:hypothetical protein [Anaerolineae bacterium]
MTTTRIPETTDQPPHTDPADLTPENVPLGQFFTQDELERMPVETLDELFMAIPDRAFFDKALEQCIITTYGMANVPDHQRSQVIDDCLLIHGGLHPDMAGISVPLETDTDGEVKWVTVSDAIIDQVRYGKISQVSFAAPEKKKINPLILVGIGVGVLVLFCVLFSLFSALLGDDAVEVSEENLTATAVVQTDLAVTPTLTPVALENIDANIKGSDNLKEYYPTMLEIQPANAASRIFPVQQRAVDYADWQFEQNPEVATSILGLVVQPVIGIPYSASNQQFLEKLVPGDTIRLQMNTGHTNTFSIQSAHRVDRQDVSIFNQAKPGIKVVLIADPAANRLVIEATYLPEQEVIDLEANLSNQQTRPHQAAQIAEGVTASVEDTYTSRGPAGAELQPEWQYLLVDVAITTAEEVELSTGTLAITATDQSGQRYTPIYVDSSITHAFPYNMPTAIAQDTTFTTTVGFLVPSNLSSASLSIQPAIGNPVSYALPYAPSTRLSASNLDVLVLDVVTEGKDQGELLLTVRLFNSHTQKITVRPNDIQAVFSPAVAEDQFPIGPAVQPDADLPIVVQPGEAKDISLRFPWSGDPYAGITIAGYQYTIQIR